MINNVFFVNLNESTPKVDGNVWEEMEHIKTSEINATNELSVSFRLVGGSTIACNYSEIGQLQSKSKRKSDRPMWTVAY